MQMDTTLHIRIDSKTKAKVQKILKGLGLDLTTAIKIYLNKVIETQSIPFELKLNERRKSSTKK